MHTKVKQMANKISWECEDSYILAGKKEQNENKNTNTQQKSETNIWRHFSFWQNVKPNFWTNILTPQGYFHIDLHIFT